MNGSSGISGAGVGLSESKCDSTTSTGGKFVGIVEGGTVEDKKHQAEPVAKTPEGVTAGVSPIYCFIGLQSWQLNWFFISNLSSLFNDVLVFVSFLDFGSGRRW